jgi:hypothetical protein
MKIRTDAIQSLRPGAQWSLNGDDYSGLEWLDTEQTKPTEKELVEESAKMQILAQKNLYRRFRSKEYPPIGDQLDALWKGGDAAAEMLARVQEIKYKYPKPE